MTPSRSAAVGVGIGALVACRSVPAPATPAPPTTMASAAAPAAPVAEAWADTTRSPWTADGVDARLASLAAACGAIDGALMRVAARVALEETDPDRVALLLRESGEPHVRPRIVRAERPFEEAAVAARLERMRTPRTRCGVAITGGARETFVAVAVEALADLEPIPTRARTGAWITFAARVHVPTVGATVVVLGPRGLPRTVPTMLDRAGGVVRARFALDRPGAFTVQLVGDTADGPAPLLEARVFADVAPSARDDGAAPGEDVPDGADPADTLARMMNALRSEEHVAVLTRDPRLDELALAHVTQMRARGKIAHDLGDGDFAARFAAASLGARIVGENVARGASLRLAHRALHASPSHRLNLLRPEFTRTGVAVARDDAGLVYVCEVFAAGLEEAEPDRDR